MRSAPRWILARTAPTVLLAALLCAGDAVADAPLVIVLSWDGVRHDYLDRVDVPALESLAAAGVRAERLVPVFPSNTFPNHVALATGAHSDRHGIVDNVFIDSERGLYSYSDDASWLEAEPIWAAAERQGVRAAVFFWVGSETDWRGTGASYRMAPFDASIGEAEKVDQILAWLDLRPDERPGLVMAWWHGADGVGHLKGPEHPDIGVALKEQDAELARLIAGIEARRSWDDTTLLVVSDHGMTEVSERIDVKGPLEAAGIDARVIQRSSTASVHLADPAQLDAASRVLKEIADTEVYTPDALPASLRTSHPKRLGDLVVLTTPPRTFFDAGLVRGAVIYLAGVFLDWHPGLHGYAPEHPDMGAIFLARGRGVPAGAPLGAVRSIDVAPTVAALLGIDPPAQAEGVVVEGFDAPRETRSSAE